VLFELLLMAQIKVLRFQFTTPMSYFTSILYIVVFINILVGNYYKMYAYTVYIIGIRVGPTRLPYNTQTPHRLKIEIK